MLENSGLKRFISQPNKLQELLLTVKEVQNPALAFYNSNAREVLFYLEAVNCKS